MAWEHHHNFRLKHRPWKSAWSSIVNMDQRHHHRPGCCKTQTENWSLVAVQLITACCRWQLSHLDQYSPPTPQGRTFQEHQHGFTVQHRSQIFTWLSWYQGPLASYTSRQTLSIASLQDSTQIKFPVLCPPKNTKSSTCTYTRSHQLLRATPFEGQGQ